MTRPVKLKTENSDVDLQYQNWLAQMVSIMMPRNLYLIAGRGSAKTVQILIERVMECVQDLPGAPFAWVSDTYSDLHKNIIPSLLDGFVFAGWKYGVHFVINETPPKSWQDRQYVIMTDYKNTMTFFTGFTFTFISLDRPSIGAGRSYVGVFGDEVKYFQEDKITNLLKAVRGYRVKFGDSPWYRSRTFTTDMPNPNHIGEYDWILKMAALNDKKSIMLMLRAGFVVNDCRKNYAVSIQRLTDARNSGASSSQLSRLEKTASNLKRTLDRWTERWESVRAASFFFIVSSYVNVDILGLDYFSDEFAEGLEGSHCNILSIIPKLEANQRFYPNLSESNFYADGFRSEVIESHPFGWEETSECLRYLNSIRPIDGGMDAGNMLSLVCGQQAGGTYRVLKEFYTLPPDTVVELGEKFVQYFRDHRCKVMKLYYDRSMNSYHKVKADMASKIKQAIETDRFGNRTGWTVQLMSLGQGDISSNMEYRFFIDLLSGNLKNRLFTLMIDRANCPMLKSEMEVTKTKQSGSQSGNLIVKLKAGDKLPTARLPKESTNLTDALKYLIMRRVWINIWSSKSSGGISSDPR